MMHGTFDPSMYPGPSSSQPPRATFGMSNERNAYGAGTTGRGLGTFGANPFGESIADTGMFGGMGDMMGFGFQGGMGGMLDQWGAVAGMGGGMYAGGAQSGGMDLEADPMSLLWGMQQGG